MASFINQDTIKAASMVNPSHFLESVGFKVVKDGERHYSVRTSENTEVYRLTKKADGRFLFCDKTGTEGGDNIKLVRTITGASFTTAVNSLLKVNIALPSRATQTPTPQAQTKQPPRVPSATRDDIAAGREYLQSRGITEKTIEYAEAYKMVRYCNGGVLFCGYGEDGSLQNVTKRATDKHEPIQKRDFKGSDKAYPAILPGIAEQVWIVEGGCDALALRDWGLRMRHPVPTIIISGGANVCSFFKKPHIQQILSKAEKVTIAHENEHSPEAQQRTDAAHDKQAELAAKYTKGEICHYKPNPEIGKDIAEANFYLINRQGKSVGFNVPSQKMIERVQRLASVRIPNGIDKFDR